MQQSNIDAVAAEHVRVAAAKARIRDAELCRRTGIKPHTFSRRMNGEGVGWQVKELVAIAHALNLDWAEFISAIGDNAHPEPNGGEAA